ncbi:MAG: DNA-methyltransferase [Bacillota bacterium]
MKPKAARNKTLSLSPAEQEFYAGKLLKLSRSVRKEEILDRIINQDILEALDFLPDSFVDLMFIDPPYNLTKSFRSSAFKELSTEEYRIWFENWFLKLLRLLTPRASVYICGDWRSSSAVHLAVEKHLAVRNRITWEREKGRGAQANWKNCAEDIWFCTVADEYTFHLEQVKLRRKVLAPYRQNGSPKDWKENPEGNYRDTHPSNLWTDISIPFWSMPENTDHPTQKPEKLLAKIILASSNPGDVVLDPFAGSGTAAVAAKKLGRRFVGIEIDEIYCCWAEKRLAMAERDRRIQGYADGIFWERNTYAGSAFNVNKGKTSAEGRQDRLFDDEFE